MTFFQVVVAVITVAYLFMSVKGMARILAQTFIPDWGDIFWAFVISFLANGIVFAAIGGIAYGASRLVD